MFTVPTFEANDYIAYREPGRWPYRAQITEVKHGDAFSYPQLLIVPTDPMPDVSPRWVNGRWCFPEPQD